MSQALLDAAEAATLFAFFGALAFVVIYGTLAPWYKSLLGWARISMDAMIVVALLPSALYYLFGMRITDSATAAYTEIGAIALVGCVCVWNAALVIRGQFRGRRAER